MRARLRWLFTILFAGVLAPVVSEFFIELARQDGLYDDPKRTIDIVMDWISWVANHQLTQYAIIGLGGITFGLWADTLLRRREKTEALRQDQVVIDSDQANEKRSISEAEQRETYVGPHEELMLFVVDALCPAGDALISLQWRIIERLCEDKTVRDLAERGVMSASWGAKFPAGWQALEGLRSSPAEFVLFDQMLQAVADCEVGYRSFVNQAEKISAASGVLASQDHEIREIFMNWRSHHGELVKAYEKFKKSTDFPGLFRPVRKSRWGDLVDINRLSVGSQFLKPEDTRA